MRLSFHLVSAAPREPFNSVARLYLERLGHSARVEEHWPRDLAAWQKAASAQKARTQPFRILLDSRGRQHSSEQLATLLATQRDQGTQEISFSIGPHAGWTPEIRSQAGLLLSFGPMTLPHELARILLYEQVYRAFTILEGHPYHLGH